MAQNNTPPKDESYKTTEEYQALYAKCYAFDKIPDNAIENVYTDDIINAYKTLLSFPIYSKVEMDRGFIGTTLYSFKAQNREQEIVLETMKKFYWKWYLITGKPGIGKTHLAIGCMISSMGQSKKKTGKYDTAEAVFLRIKRNFGSEENVVAIYVNYDVLVLDECEAEKLTAYKDNDIKGVFQEIIRKRDIAKKQTIIVGNNPDEVFKIIGSNGYSRINGAGEIFELTSENWIDVRPKIKERINADGEFVPL